MLAKSAAPIVRWAVLAVCLLIFCGPRESFAQNQTLPSGTVGVPYNLQLTFTNGVGQACPLPVTTTLNSPPPPVPGLTLSSTGLISGTPTTSGSFQFTFTFVSGTSCGPTTVTDTINVSPAPVTPPVCTISQSPVNPVAPGTAVTLTANCTNSPTSYSWSTGATSQSINVTPTQSTAYTVIAANTGGASAPVVANVVVNAAPPVCSISQIPGNPVAPGTTVTLTANCINNPTSYSWSTGATSQSINVTPIQSTTYTLTAANAGGPSAPATANVVVNAATPVCSVSQSPANPVAPGTKVTLTANCTNNPTSYSWSTGATSQSINVTPTQSTTYTVTAHNTAGSSAPINANVVVNAATPVCSVSQIPLNPVSPGTTVTLTANCTNNPTAYSWSTGATSQSINVTPTQSTTYTVTARNAAGSSAPASINVAVNSNQQAVVAAKQVVTPQAQTAVTAPTIQISNVQQRLDRLRLQSSPAVAEGLRVSYDGKPMPSLNSFGSIATEDGKVQSGGGASADKLSQVERWGVYINGDVDVGRQSAIDTQTGFKVTSKGITLGTDYQFTGNHVLGVSLGFLKADTDLDAGAGSQDAKGYSLSVYGSYVPTENAYIDGILNVGHNKYDSQRRETTGDFATSNTSGNQLGLALSIGYQFNKGGWALTPYGRVEYIDANVNGFTENGTPGEAVAVGDTRIKGTTLTIGGQASYAFSTSWGVFLPNARLEFQHLAQRSINDISVHVVGQGVTTPAGEIPILGEDRNFGRFGLGASAVFPRGISAFFDYEQLFAKQNFSDRHFTLGLRVQF